ncbi:MAG TPA: adenylate/guanylate cyclase domain-containing protein [Gaiellaceae bacterium]|nr:adenylate/guanylate cyclase domain-containing protein [Gaiellaceae bacterium]
MDVPETRYAKSGDVSIAYQVTGDGPVDLVWVQGFLSNVELGWQMPTLAVFNRRLGEFCRLIRFDKRGTGMSDRVGIATLETRMDDVRAVMDAVGSPRAALLGSSEGGPLSLLFAATYPERTRALVLWSSFPRYTWAPDYPWGLTEQEAQEENAAVLRSWSDLEAMAKMVEVFAPGSDEETKRRLATIWRQSASPRDVDALNRMSHELDVRNVISAITAPTLVMNREGEDRVNVEGSRYLAEHIAGARYVQFPGADHIIASGDAELVLEEIRGFLTTVSEEPEPEPDRVLATVLFTDIVGSTAKAAELGDRGWRELLERHHSAVRRELTRHRGRELDTAGDGFFAAFDGPARAIRCASTIAETVGELGIEIRAGLHTGECELLDGKVAGIAVSIGARVAAQASPGEVLVSQTVRDLVAGSGISFDDRGTQELKGVPGEWRLYAVSTNA